MLRLNGELWPKLCSDLDGFPKGIMAHVAVMAFGITLCLASNGAVSTSVVSSGDVL